MARYIRSICNAHVGRQEACLYESIIQLVAKAGGRSKDDDCNSVGVACLNSETARVQFGICRDFAPSFTAIGICQGQKRPISLEHENFQATDWSCCVSVECKRERNAPAMTAPHALPGIRRACAGQAWSARQEAPPVPCADTGMFHDCLHLQVHIMQTVHHMKVPTFTVAQLRVCSSYVSRVRYSKFSAEIEFNFACAVAAPPDQPCA